MKSLSACSAALPIIVVFASIPLPPSLTFTAAPPKGWNSCNRSHCRVNKGWNG
jgi:hypothetical protein